jgi:hypothetical protein
MLKMTDLGRGVVGSSSRHALRYAFRSSCRFPLGTSARFFGLAAAALLMLSATTSERAQALSLINPGAVAPAKIAADGLTTEVRGGHGGGGHGGGGHGGGYGGGHGWGGGGVRSGAAIHSGAFRTGPVFTGGGVRSGVRFGGHRFGHRHHRRFFAGGYYDDYPYYDYPYYASPGCRIVVTDYGPRRVCNTRHWRHHHYRRHHHRRHHRVYR